METRLTEIFQWMRRHGSTEDMPAPVLTRRYTDEAVSRQVDDEGQVLLETGLPALYGRHGVLPDYFTDELQLLGEKRDAMRFFLDIFNHRLFKALFDTWQQHQLFTEHALESETDHGNDEARLLARLSGQLGKRELPLHIQGLRWHRMNLYRARTRTADGLKSLVQAFFPELKIELETFVTITRKIPEEQQAELGNPEKPLRIGMQGNFLTGKNFDDPRGGIRIRVKALDYESFMKLQPPEKETPEDDRWRDLLAELVHDYTRGTPRCKLHLELLAEEIPTWQLGSRRIGKDMWSKAGTMKENAQIDAGILVWPPPKDDLEQDQEDPGVMKLPFDPTQLYEHDEED
ncbi:MAG: type VI secretion system baseplate subunit TssG [Acidobacteriota bacterium]|nr:type VI secretion system baseplate subunit TssG [Acidobacteriota bacterium]